MGDSPVRRRPWAGGAATAFSVAALATAAGALPAQADSSRTSFTVTASARTLVAPAADGAGGYSDLLVSFAADDGSSTLAGVKVAVDGRQLARLAELRLPAPCTFTDAEHLQALCAPGDFAGGGGHLTLGVRAAEGAPAGAAGKILFTVTATNATVNRTSGRDVTEVRVGEGPQLSVAQLPVLTRTKPGATATLAIGLTNQGDREAHGVLLWFRIPERYAPAAAFGDFGNCRYPDGAAGLVLCRFDDAVVRPGEVLRPSVPVALVAGDDPRDGRFEYGADLAGGPTDRLLTAAQGAGRPGTGAPLTLTAGPAGGFGSEAAFTYLETGRPYALSAVAGDVAGVQGATVPATFALRNDGDAPATVRGGRTADGEPVGLLVSFPPGVRITGAPADCVERPAGPTVYLCAQTRTLASGEFQAYTFQVLLADPLDRAPGRASVEGQALAGAALFTVTSGAAPAPTTIRSYTAAPGPALRAVAPAAEQTGPEPSAPPATAVTAAAPVPSPSSQASLGAGLAETGVGTGGLSLAATGGLAVGLGLGLIGMAARRHWAGSRG
ncbi:hypothetical protein [Streptomyces sp. CB03911]|uniref:hypothetical protein n=1 Tax=Streptomyces sp. CB03911 TaxID=1804758 RepID=UPI0009389DAB|nr:hypothetical protein [Streptomyces sp. CB03911]OKI11737.1 hypothetical protein A6A07_20590 [Streptomyces sp. CB03911]